MTGDDLERALEWTISDVAKREFQRLMRGLSPDQRKNQLSKARISLDRLRTLNTPDYSNELVTLMYLAQYQLGHINLALSTIRHIESHRTPSRLLLGDTDKLHFIDFGGGALAGQFGVSIAVASMLSRGEEISSVKVDSIDTSRSMLNIGSLTWAAFVKYVFNHLSNTSIALACEMISDGFETHMDYQNISAVPNADVWLTAFHTIYRTNQSEIKDALDYLYKRHNPVAGAITCYYEENSPSLGNVEIARRVSPFALSDLQQLNGLGITPQLSIDRRSMDLAAMFREWGLFPENYRQIFWGWVPDKTAFLTYAPNQKSAVITPEPQPVQPAVHVETQQARRIQESGAGYQDTETSTPSEQAQPSQRPTPILEGDQVNVRGIGNGKVVQIRKNKATVTLDRGLRCEVSISQLKPL